MPQPRRKRLAIPCQHETKPGLPPDETVPDYYPLSYEEMRGLITRAFNDRSIVSDVQVRLNQAIKGMECPRAIEGPVARKMARLDGAYIKAYHKGDAEGAIKKVAKILGLEPAGFRQTEKPVAVLRPIQFRG